MELGALVCTAPRPAATPARSPTGAPGGPPGSPAYDGPPRRAQAWAGTDRQCRGRLHGRAARRRGHRAPRPRLDAAWTEEGQRDRCLAGLVDDGLVVLTDAGYALP